MFVNWALRSVRESLIQVDPLAAALAYREREPKRPLPAIVSRTPLLLQFTPFAGPGLMFYLQLFRKAQFEDMTSTHVCFPKTFTECV